MKKIMKKSTIASVVAVMLAILMVVSCYRGNIFADTTGYYTATQIEEMGGKVHQWKYLLTNYGVKEANVYGWLCEVETTDDADAFCFYLTPGAADFFTSGRIDGGVTTQEDTYNMALDNIKGKSEKMYQYLTTDDLTFEEAAGLVKTQVQPEPTQNQPNTTPAPEETTEPVIATPTPHEPVNPDITFVDVNEGDWYYDAVMTMARNGIVMGKGNDVFDPNAPITVGEMCALISRLDTHVYVYPFKAGETLNTVNYGERTFDEPTSWAHQYIMAVRNAGDLMVSKYKLPKWDPEAYNEPIRRGEAMWVCVAFANRMVRYNDPYGGYWTASYRGSDNGWRVRDDDIPDWCIQSWESDYDKNEHFWNPTSHVKAAYRLGIVQGVDAEHNCNASGNLTRAEMCQMFYNMGLTTDTNVNNPYYVPESYYTIPTERPW